MGYYVIGDQGQKYGPAEVATLNQWVAERRLLPQTMLEDELSGGQIVASAVTGLNFPVAAAPTASNYPRYDQAPQYRPQAQPYPMNTGVSGKSEFGLALALGLISPVL